MPSSILKTPIFTGVAKIKQFVSSTPTEDILHRRIKNRHLPVLQLCPDIIEYLFLLAVEPEQDSLSVQRAAMSYSHTCHDWRVIALSVKALWIRLIDFEGRSCKWNAEMLRRSHPLPIDVSYHANLSRGTKVLCLQLDHLDRIQTYSVSCRDTDWDILVEMLKRPAPSLEALDITCHQLFGSAPSVSAIVPVSLFGHFAPKLRQLVMKACILDFKSPLLRSLTCLRIMDLSYDNAPTVVEWLDYLGKMPSLEELHLQDAILPSRYQPEPSLLPGDQGSMPLILNLVLEAPLSDVSSLLYHLPMPAQCHWRLTCLESAPGTDLDKVLQVFSDGLRNAYSSTEPCPLLIAVQKSDVVLRSELIAEEVSSPIGLFVDFRTSAYHPGWWESLFPSVASGLGDAMPQVTSLELIIPTVHPSLLPILRRASRLNTLVKLSAKLSKILLPQLQVPLFSGGIPLPALDRVVFADDRSMWGASYQSFTCFLRWRSQMSAPIRFVYFLRCQFPEDAAKEMMGLGIDVDGDLEGARWQNL